MFEQIDYNKYEYIVYGLGIVGNRKAMTAPTYIYEKNMRLLLQFTKELEEARYKGQIFYLSSTDIDGTEGTTPSIFDNKSVNMPKSTYGLSKRHGGEYLQTLTKQGKIKSTVIYMSMHESKYREGDYVLTKIKHIVKNDRKMRKREKTEFMNLNIMLELGHAEQYMKALSSIIANFKEEKYIIIGTGKYSNLLKVCTGILEANGLDPDETIRHTSKENPTYMPKFDLVELEKQFKNYGLDIPERLAGDMLI